MIMLKKKKSLNKINKIKKSKERKPSDPKRLLIELLFNYNSTHMTDNVPIILYNGILVPKVKDVNKQKVKGITMRAPK